MTGMHILSAVCNYAYSRVPDLMSLILLTIGNGVYFGWIEGSKMVLIMQLWGSECLPFVQTQSLVFGMGSLIAPALVAPFLREEGLAIGSNEGSDGPETELRIPFNIVSAFMLFDSFILILLWIWCPETTDHPSRGQADDTQDDVSPKLSGIWRKVVLILHLIGVHINYGVQMIMGQFLVTFAVTSRLQMTKESGAHLTTMYWIVFTLTNLLSITYIKRIGVGRSILLSSGLVVAGSGLLCLVGETDESFLWLGVLVVGFGDAHIYAAVFCYLESVMSVTSCVSSLTVMAIISGEMTMPAIVALFIQDHPMILMLMAFVCSCLMLVVYSLVVFISNQKIDCKKKDDNYQSF